MAKKGKSRRMRGGDTKTVLRDRGFSNAAIEAALAAERATSEQLKKAGVSSFSLAGQIAKAAEAAAKRIANEEAAEAKRIANEEAAEAKRIANEEAVEQAAEQERLTALHEETVAKEAREKEIMLSKKAQKNENNAAFSAAAPLFQREIGKPVPAFQIPPEGTHSTFFGSIGNAFRRVGTAVGSVASRVTGSPRTSGGKRTHKKRKHHKKRHSKKSQTVKRLHRRM
jgi:D-serine deaminase-like pyridoxal phosphate-dependent protein